MIINRSNSAPLPGISQDIQAHNLDIVNSSGQKIISLGSTATGEPKFLMYSKTGQLQVILMLGKKENPGLMMRGAHPLPLITIGIQKDGKPSCEIANTTGSVDNIIVHPMASTNK